MRPIYILLYKIGPISYLPNGPAQAQNFYGAISPTHRRSKYAKMNLQLKSGWYKCFATQKDYLLSGNTIMITYVFVLYFPEKI